MNDRNTQISKRAFEIWEAEGRRSGEESRHWHQAEREIDAVVPLANASDRGSTSDADMGTPVADRDFGESIEGTDAKESAVSENEGKVISFPHASSGAPSDADRQVAFASKDQSAR